SPGRGRRARPGPRASRPTRCAPRTLEPVAPDRAATSRNLDAARVLPTSPQMVGNLSIRSKLIPLLAVPVAGSLLLGVAGVGGEFGKRARAAEEARVAAVSGRAVAAAHELQEERVRAVTWLATAAKAGPTPRR